MAALACFTRSVSREEQVCWNVVLFCRLGEQETHVSEWVSNKIENGGQQSARSFCEGGRHTKRHRRLFILHVLENGVNGAKSPSRTTGHASTEGGPCHLLRETSIRYKAAGVAGLRSTVECSVPGMRNPTIILCQFPKRSIRQLGVGWDGVGLGALKRSEGKVHSLSCHLLTLFSRICLKRSSVWTNDVQASSHPYQPSAIVPSYIPPLPNFGHVNHTA